MRLHAVRFEIALLTWFCAWAIACGPGEISFDKCSMTDQKLFVFNVMHDTYLWYRHVPIIRFDEYATPEELLEALKYAPLDRWSYITDEQDFSNLHDEGTYVGFGFSSAIAETQDAFLIRYVFDDSPAGAAGWQRSDAVVAINDVPASQIIAEDSFNEMMGPRTEGYTVRFSVRNLSGEVVNHTLSKRLVRMNTVIASSILDIPRRRVGYMAFISFLATSVYELYPVFAEFHQAPIDELVVDLRYNSGGRVYTALHLASLIGGRPLIDSVFAQIRHNDRYRQYDGSLFFEFAPTNALELSRVFVLTTEDTCSASELIINSLSPFIQVIQVGTPTCGKPVGMYGASFCGKRILPIEFQTFNADGEGDYFEGLTPNCTVNDDITTELGNRRDAMLAEVLAYLENGDCSVSPIKSRPAPRSMRATPLNPNY